MATRRGGRTRAIRDLPGPAALGGGGGERPVSAYMLRRQFLAARAVVGAVVALAESTETLNDNTGSARYHKRVTVGPPSTSCKTRYHLCHSLLSDQLTRKCATCSQQANNALKPPISNGTIAVVAALVFVLLLAFRALRRPAKATAAKKAVGDGKASQGGAADPHKTNGAPTSW
eukprot:scaffold856_cov229-Prasinococcus_capsulatus_cf.AAC.2